MSELIARIKALFASPRRRFLGIRSSGQSHPRPIGGLTIAGKPVRLSRQDLAIREQCGGRRFGCIVQKAVLERSFRH